MLRAGKRRTIFVNCVVFLADGTAAKELLGGFAEDALRGRIHGDDRACGVLVNHALQHRFRQQTVALFALLKRFLGLLHIVDVGAIAKPFVNISMLVENRHAMNQPPAINPIKSAKPTLKQIGGVVEDGILPGIPGTLAVIGVEWFVPPRAIAFFQRESGIIDPLLIEISVQAVCPSGPDDLGHRFGQQAELPFTQRNRLFRPFLCGDVAPATTDPIILPSLSRMGAKL